MSLISILPCFASLLAPACVKSFTFLAPKSAESLLSLPLISVRLVAIKMQDKSMEKKLKLFGI